MIIHPLQEDTTSSGESSPYDSVWSNTEVPVQQREGLEKVMLQDDKLYVVLAVVLIIWVGIIFFLYRTDRKIDRLERNMTERISEKSGHS
jgi:CcmD family protein